MSVSAGMEQLDPLVRRMLAPNPSPFTFTGTQTYVVGRGEVAVIDPGPDITGHIDALLGALKGERVVAILCTHTHRDHSPASRALRQATGAAIIGCAPLALDDDGPRADTGFDPDYRPDDVLGDGDRLQREGWTIEAVATPGHTSNHLCFALCQNRALFSGDHVMGWSTTAVAPPDGDMRDYMESLDRLLARDDAIYYPAHGPAVERPKRLVRSMLSHRRQRERQILRHLEKDEGSIPQMVGQMYRGLDPRLHAAAGRSILAHLLDLEVRGKVIRGDHRWHLAS